MTTIVREPLVQFLLGGLLLFMLIGPADEPAIDTITVNDETLALFWQYQTKSFDPEKARKIFAALPEDARARLEAEYIENEILYREALSLGLDTGDDVIRKRLIQKMEFLIQGTEAPGKSFSEEEIQDFFEANKEDYRQPAVASFTHIFLSRENDALEAELATISQHLQHQNPMPSATGRMGDRFPYLRTYADRPERVITEHFGATMAGHILSDAKIGQWSGPTESPLGFHFVWVHKRRASRMPEIEDVASRVVADMQRIQRDERRARTIAALKDRYIIERDTP